MKTNLFETHDEDTWHLLRWPEFVDWKDKENTTIIVPVCGFCDWGLGMSLDAEEIVCTAILKEALKRLDPKIKRLVVPTQRFVFAPYAYSFFGIDPDSVHDCIEDLMTSLKASGFKKILSFNSSPWNECLIDAAGRDLRIKLGVQPFLINLSGIHLDFLPGRSTSRKELQLLITYLTQKEGTPSYPQVPLQEIKTVPAHFKKMPTESTCPTLEEANKAGPRILQAKAHHLASLIAEVDSRPPLPHEGVIPYKLNS